MRATLLLLLMTVSLSAKQLNVPVTAPSAILVNFETGVVLYGKGIHERRFPASTTKIATALYVIENKVEGLEGMVETSREALITIPAFLRQAVDSAHPSYRLEPDGTNIGLRRGEKMSVRSLLYGLLLSSGNDAANVLAEATCGTIEQFVGELNRFIRDKGLTCTQFTNPHGLHHMGHWTTASDMAHLTRIALKNPVFSEIVKTTQHVSEGSFPKTFLQFNRLLRQGPFYYPRAIGVKTGRTGAAGTPLVAAAVHEGRTLIAVLLGGEGQNRYRDAIKLFDAAFGEKKVTRMLFAKEQDCFKHEMKGARDPLRAVLREDVRMEYFPAEEVAFRAEIEWKGKRLPIKAGEMVGYLRCVDGVEGVLVEKELFAVEGVTKKGWVKVVEFYQEHVRIFGGLLLVGLIGLLAGYILKKGQKIV